MTGRRALGALLIVAAVWGAGCTSSDGALDESPTASARLSASPSPSEKPRRGGSVRVGVVGAPATLDPYSPVASDLTHALVRPIYPSLYTLSPRGRPEPSLAQRLEPAPGGTRIVLRRARWSDGSRVTSGDVVASIARAPRPSGFTRIGKVRAVSPRALIVRGTLADWPRALATLGYVLPDGIARGNRGGLMGGSSWRIVEHRPGLKVVYGRNRFAADDARPYLERVTVFFYESESVLLDSLRHGDVDVAVPPSTINLTDRLEQMGVMYDYALGWESIWLDLRQTLSRPERSAFVAAINRGGLEDSIIRDGGRVSQTLHPGPRGAAGFWKQGYGKRSKIRDAVRLSIPSGDEGLFLLQRAIQIQLSRRKIDVDLIVGSAADFYGPWRTESPADVALIRSAGAPTLRDAARFHKNVTAFPLAHVRTHLAWQPRINGPDVNPTFDGPLWNMATWWLSPWD